MGRAVQGLIGGGVLLLGVVLGLRGPELWAELGGLAPEEGPVAGRGEAARPEREELAVEAPQRAEEEAGAGAEQEAPGPDLSSAAEPSAAVPSAAVSSAEGPSALGPPVGPPPPALPADLAGALLVSLRPGGVLEARRVDGSRERPPRRLAPPAGPVEQLCTDGTVLALAGPVDVELRRLADDHFLERLRPARPRVDRVLCPGSGAVVAVALGAAGVATWWDAEGRERGRLQPPTGIVAVAESGDEVIILDGSGELRSWDGRRRQERGPLGHEGAAVDLVPALGGPPWALFGDRACRAGGSCREALGARGLAAAGEGWLAVAGPDRVQLFDAVGGGLLHELPARPTGLFVAPTGALLVVEPDGLRGIAPASGTEQWSLRW